MNQEKKGKVHPIVERALEMARHGIEPVELDDYAVEQLQELLKERFGKPDLLRAVVDLINLAGVLDDQRSHSASMKLMIVVSIAGDALKESNKSKNFK
jgi:hypothetical protein